MATCPYHGRFKSVEWHDWQCPKCEQEIQDFSAFSSGKTKDPKTSMGILVRSGAISKSQATGIELSRAFRRKK